jgi:hypothetical protein
MIQKGSFLQVLVQPFSHLFPVRYYCEYFTTICEFRISQVQWLRCGKELYN